MWHSLLNKWEDPHEKDDVSLTMRGHSNHTHPHVNSHLLFRTSTDFYKDILMASKMSSHLTCPVCLCLFNDPTVLPCEHTFCRLCILSCLDSGATRCPECRQNFTKQDLKGNRALRNLVDDVQQEQKTNKVKKQQQNARNTDAVLCSEHEEPLKLFCEDDQKLVCLICREGEKHGGHSFKPVKEAVAAYEVMMSVKTNMME